MPRNPIRTKPCDAAPVNHNPHHMPSSSEFDPKRGEREYFAKIGPEGIAHSLAKPYADDNCAQYLAVMTALFGLLPPPPARLLEFGCGTGWLSLALGQRGYRVLGTDISPDAVRHALGARDARSLPEVDFRMADYETFDGGGAFDAAIFHDSLHHAEDERAALASAYRALKPGGFVLTFEPGAGHHESSTAQHAIREFGVHEKSMPPHHIITLGRTVGFRHHLVLPHPHDLNRALYRRAYHGAADRGELRSRRLLSLFRALHRLFSTRDHGLVVLWK